MNHHQVLLKKGVASGLRKGGKGFLWLLKILVPISLFTALLAWSGFIHRVEFLTRPMMSWLGLPAVAAFPILIGLLTGIYGAIAAMAVLPFTQDQLTLIAIFMLMAHNLIQEGIIQGKTGLHFLKATLFRLAAASITVIIVSQFLASTPEAPAFAVSVFSETPSLLLTLKDWFLSTLHLCVRILLVMMGIMILLEVLKTFDWMRPLAKRFSPVLKLMGLNENVGLLWMTGAVFGLVLGSAVILEESKEGHLEKEELESLHLSIGINHSFIEDPALFMAMGLNAFWLWVPRLIMAIVLVHLFGLWQRRKKRWARGSPPKH